MPAAEDNHTDADCFVCVFLSHGEDDHVYAHDGKVYIRDVTALFKGDKCRSLVGKPKIFILQVESNEMLLETYLVPDKICQHYFSYISLL